MKYEFWETEGHGYLKVPYMKIYDLDIEDEITEYSYWSKSKNYVYLEEDLDLSIFLKAINKEFDDVIIKPVNFTDQRIIDNYEPYKKPTTLTKWWETIKEL